MDFCLRLKLFSERVKVPSYGTDESAGLDVCAFFPESNPVVVLYPGDSLVMPLGFATEFSPGYGILLIPRSGIGSRMLELKNTVGLIDADYREEWVLRLRHKGEHGIDAPISIVHGERIAQAVPVVVPRAVVRIVESLAESGRSGGFGSTGSM